MLTTALCIGCAHSGATLDAHPPAAATIESGWKTMQAEQLVQLEVTRKDGVVERRSMRAALAVARPDRFRLRALGPGGLTLFDLLDVDGRVAVLGGVLPKSDAFAQVVRSVAADLAAAYLLSPAPPERTTTVDAQGVWVHEAERAVRLSDFHQVDGRAVPTRIEVDAPAHGYHVRVQVSAAALDVPLDPALFTQ